MNLVPITDTNGKLWMVNPTNVVAVTEEEWENREQLVTAILLNSDRVQLIYTESSLHGVKSDIERGASR